MKMAAMVAIFCFTACGQNIAPSNQKQADKSDSLLSARNRTYQSYVFPEIKKLVASGDIITRMGTDITSLMLSKVNPTDSSFSHCGIINIENDSIFVYHAMGGEYNPDQKMRRELLFDFGKPADSKCLGIFCLNLQENQKRQLGNYVKQLQGKGLPFDMEFDLKTDEKQYCTEMVAKSIGKIVGRMDWAGKIQVNSIQFIPVEYIYHNEMVKEKKRFVY